MKKRDPYPMNEMDHKFGKIVIFSKQYKNFRNPKMLFDGLGVYLRHTWAHKQIIEHVLKLIKCNIFSLQNSLSCQAEYPFKPNITVAKFNECLIE